MEVVSISIDPEKFDQAIHGGFRDFLPVLPERGDLAMYVKPKATQGGNAGVCITFTVVLPDGQIARAQAVTTALALESALACIRGWRSGGHI